MDIEFVRSRFIKHFDGKTGNIYQSPGRINLIGEHTDYNGGFVFPGAVEVGPPTYILSYLTSAKDAVNPGMGMDAGYCGTLAAVYFIFMLIGRFVGGVIGGKVSPQ